MAQGEPWTLSTLIQTKAKAVPSAGAAFTSWARTEWLPGNSPHAAGAWRGPQLLQTQIPVSSWAPGPDDRKRSLAQGGEGQACTSGTPQGAHSWLPRGEEPLFTPKCCCTTKSNWRRGPTAPTPGLVETTLQALTTPSAQVASATCSHRQELLKTPRLGRPTGVGEGATGGHGMGIAGTRRQGALASVRAGERCPASQRGYRVLG